MPDELEKASEIVCKYCPYPYGEWAYCAYCVKEFSCTLTVTKWASLLQLRTKRKKKKFTM